MLDAPVIKQIVVARFLRGNTAYPLELDTDLLQAGICDSMGLLELAMEIEKAVPGVRIDDQDITTANFGSVQRIMNFLSTKTAG
jgi:acyl carrier protein